MLAGFQGRSWRAEVKVVEEVLVRGRCRLVRPSLLLLFFFQGANMCDSLAAKTAQEQLARCTILVNASLVEIQLLLPSGQQFRLSFE